VELEEGKGRREEVCVIQAVRGRPRQCPGDDGWLRRCSGRGRGWRVLGFGLSFECERDGALVRVRRSGGLGWDLSGRGRGRTPPGMALAVWPRWAACVSRSKKTRRGVVAMPAG
jgi:hypothetical protein